MLNPKLYEKYGESVVNAFKELAKRAEADNSHIGLLGINYAHNVVAPAAVYTEEEDYVTLPELFKIFKTYAPNATDMDMDVFGSLVCVDGATFWEKRKKESTELWVH